MNIPNIRTPAPFTLRSVPSADADADADNDNDNASLILRPATFSRPEHLVLPPPTPLHSFLLPSSCSYSTELIELAEAQTAVRLSQDTYPPYDVSPRRIGLDHVPNTSTGYYRKHVLEYGTPPRNAGASSGSSRPSQQPHHPQPFPQRQTSPQLPPPQSLPPPSYPPQPSRLLQVQATVQGNRYHEHGPLPPVSAVIAGIRSDSHFGIGLGSFSHIQNRPRPPHEILGLPQDAPLNLWSLEDPETPDAKPQYNYHVLVKLAILGNKDQKATLQDILRAIRLRFPYYAKLPKQEAVAFGNSIRHLLSLLAAFVREPKPVTEPGKGSYWRVDFSKGEGNKRIRKRNKPQKKTNDSDVHSLDHDSGNGKQQGKQSDVLKEKRESRSESGDSEKSGSPSTETLINFESPYARSLAETWLPPAILPRPLGKGGRKPAPKNLTTTPNSETTTTILTEFPTAPRNEYYIHIHMERGGPAPGTLSRSQPFLQLRPGNHDVGPHRDHMVRGAARAAPYPPPRTAMPNGRTSSDAESISSERCNHRSNMHPETNRRAHDQDLTMRLTNGSHSIREQQYNNQRDVLPTHRTHNEYAYNQHYKSGSGRYDSISPLESPASNQSSLSADPYKNPSLNGSTAYAAGLMDYASLTSSSRVPHKTTASVGSTSNDFMVRSRMSMLNRYHRSSSSSASASGMMSSAPAPYYVAHRNSNTVHTNVNTMQSTAGTGATFKPPPV